MRQKELTASNEESRNSSCRNRRAGILYVPLPKRAATSENKQVSCKRRTYVKDIPVCRDVAEKKRTTIPETFQDIAASV